MTKPKPRAGLFLPAHEDPRQAGPSRADERSILLEYLRCQRLTLELKCSGLDAEQLAARTVPPSTMSLLGIVRHMAEVEQGWFRHRFAGEQAPKPFSSAEEPDADFDGAAPDPAAVEQAWRVWRAECAFSDRFVAGAPDLEVLGTIPGRGPISLRELLVHMVEEYARHNGHADLLRERIDGRIGE